MCIISSSFHVAFERRFMKNLEIQFMFPCLSVKSHKDDDKAVRGQTVSLNGTCAMDMNGITAVTLTGLLAPNASESCRRIVQL